MDKLKELELIRDNVNRWIQQCETKRENRSIWIGFELKRIWQNIYTKKELIKIKEHIQRKEYREAKEAYEKFRKDYPEF